MPKFGQVEFHGHSVCSLGVSNTEYDRAFPARVASILGAELKDDSYPSQAQSISNIGSVLLDGGWAWQLRYSLNPGLRTGGGGTFSWETARELAVFVTGYNDIGQAGPRTVTVGAHTLPLGSPFELVVADNTLFDSAGTLQVTNDANDVEYVDYTGKSGTTKFTGCTGGSGAVSNGKGVFQWSATAGADVFKEALIAGISRARASNVFIPTTTVRTDYTFGDSTLNLTSTNSFPNSGRVYIYNDAGDLQIVDYSGRTTGFAPTLTGCSGGTGTALANRDVQGLSSITRSGGTDIEAGTWPVIHGTGYTIYRVDTTGDYVEVNTPSDFPGGVIALAFLVGPDQSGGTWTISNDATGTVALENSGPYVPSGFDDWSWGVKIFRTPNLSAGVNTIRATWTKGTGDYGYFDSWWHEAIDSPLVGVANQAYGPGINSEINVLNQVTDEAIAEFNDDNVFLIDFNSKLVYSPTYPTSDMSDGVHLNDRGHRKAAEEIVTEVLSRSRTLTDSAKGNAVGNGLQRLAGRGVDSRNILNRIEARSGGDTPLTLRASYKSEQTEPILRIEDERGNLGSYFDHDQYLVVKNGLLDFASTLTNEASFTFPHSTIAVDDASGFDSQGFAFFPTEKIIIKYTGKTATSLTGVTLQSIYGGSIPNNSLIQQGRGISFGGGSKIWEGLPGLLQLSATNIQALGTLTVANTLSIADGQLSIVTTPTLGAFSYAQKAMGDTYLRFGIDVNGSLYWGDGTSLVGDVALSRTAANELTLTAGDKLKTDNPTSAQHVATKSYVDGGAWQAISYDNNWTDFGGTYSDGSYYLKGDRVYLGGAVARTSGSSYEINNALPVGYRPPATIVIPIATFGGTGLITIGSNGIMTLGDGSGDATTFACLEGVSWRVT
jgi:hypothetical protein